ncbi:hypothetical protein LCGC14_2812550, partial [marine sediment metagenome]
AEIAKAVGMMEQLKRKGGKEPAEAIANASYLMAKAPSSVPHMMTIFKGAQKLQEAPLIKWICDLLLLAMREAKKPSRQTCTMIAKAFSEVEAYAEAVQACDVALAAYPEDGDLAEMAKNMSARNTIKDGQYGGDGSFVDSVRDMKKQVDMVQSDQMSQSREFIDENIVRARAEYEENPQVPGKINGLAEALLKVEEDAYENEAIDILRKAYVDSKAYRFKVRMDDVQMRRKRRRTSKLKADGDKKAAIAAARDLLTFELTVFAERAKNYPTDLSIKFELGRRQLIAGQIDDAIGSLQDAQRDPKRRLSALGQLGRAFAKKGWHNEAIETYERALAQDPTEARAKELQYNLALSLEATGEEKQALARLSQVAQIDYNYRDVRDRIEALRHKADEGAGTDQ